MKNRGFVIALVSTILFLCVETPFFLAGKDRLFPDDLPVLEWVNFSAAGYTVPVAGMIFDDTHQTDCGVALGGISTGALDLEVSGTIGFDTIFQNYPRKPQRFEPFLGLSLGGKSWVLASPEIIQGGLKAGSYEPGASDGLPAVHVPEVEGVESAHRISYFGHYPVADYEYQTGATVEVGLRAWAPFIPGDVAASSIPAIVFEVHLRNRTQQVQKGTVALNYPGVQTAREVNTRWANSRQQGERIFTAGAAPFDGKALPEKSPRMARPNPRVGIPLLPQAPYSRPIDEYPLSLGGKMVIGDPSGDGRNELLVGLKDAQTGRGILISFQRTPETYGRSREGSGRYEHEIIDVLPDNGFTALALGDADNDGRTDIIAGTLKGEVFLYARKSPGFGGGNVEPLRNYARRRLTPEQAGGHVSEVCIGDVDGDGKNEVVYTTGRQEGARSLPGAYLIKAGSVFPITRNAEAEFLGCGLGDYNGDGRTEIAVGSKSPVDSGNFVRLFALNATGGVKSAETIVRLRANEGPQWLASGDFNGDGRDDLLVGSIAWGTRWLERTGSAIGTKRAWSKPEVASAPGFAAYSNPQRVYPGDPRTYIAVGAQNSMLLGRLDGPQVPAGSRARWGLERYYLGPPGQDRPSSTALTGVALGDLSGDGVPDVVTWQESPRLPTDWTVEGGLFGLSLVGEKFFDVPRPRTVERTIDTSPYAASVTTQDGNQYALLVLDGQKGRFGGDLTQAKLGWAKIAEALPEPSPAHTGTSAAVDFQLGAGETHVLRFALVWYVPQWGSIHTYTRMNMTRYRGAMDIARQINAEHESLLRRILAWQQAIYATADYPIWLRDALINTLLLFAEDSYWAVCKPPLGDWCSPDGLYGMIESPRGAPQIECIPCSWYGNIPILYFFPQLTHTTLQGFRHYQRSDGAMAFNFGGRDEMWSSGDHGAENQIALNGYCFVDMVHRQWLRTGDDRLVEEFYPAVKAATQFALSIRPKEYGMVHMPLVGSATEWWEAERKWSGLTTHAGSLNLASLLMAERMAIKAGDLDFAHKCRSWFEQGRRVMEGHLWDEKAYLLFQDPSTGSSSNEILANQFDAEWVSFFHGLPRVFDPDHFKKGLETIRNSCIVDKGAVAYATREGVPQLTAYGNFVPEMFILAMTYFYAGDREAGFRIAKGCLDNLYKAQRIPYDWPNHIRADTGERTFGTDYYQNMIVWAIPAALAAQDLRRSVAAGEFIDRVIKAGRAPGNSASYSRGTPGLHEIPVLDLRPAGNSQEPVGSGRRYPNGRHTRKTASSGTKLAPY